MSYLGEDIKKLGFGLMRLPRLEDGTIDTIACQWRSRACELGLGDITWYQGDEHREEPEMWPIVGTENIRLPNQN